MRYQHPLARVRGLGSAHEGTHHFWAQRLSALALVPLGLWFLVSLLGLIGADHATVAAWVASPLPTVLLIGFIGAVFYHGQLGLQVVFEDYIRAEGVKIAAIAATRLGSALLCAAAVVAVLRVAFTA